jgi:uncharacterized membrane protein
VPYRWRITGALVALVIAAGRMLALRALGYYTANGR